MKEPNIPLLTDIVEDGDSTELPEDSCVGEPEISDPIDIQFGDSTFIIADDIVVFEVDGSRRVVRDTPYVPPDDAFSEPEVMEPRQTVGAETQPADDDTWRIGADDMEMIVAELQTRIASHTYALTDDLMRGAFAEFEAKVFRQISTRLREQLPELIDSVVREHLLERSRNSRKGD